jgi:glycosyltransferase involved in cell wall biosynthesis
MIGRADSAGLGSQSLEVVRHLKPERLLLVDMSLQPGYNAGPFRPERFDFSNAEIRVCVPKPGQELDKADVDWLLETDSLFSIETPYSRGIPRVAWRRRVILSLYSNPELWSEDYRAPTTRVYLPTTWEADRVPQSSVLPMPIARDRLPFRQRTEAKTFLFQCGTTFHDRNGRRVLDAALRHVRVPIRVLVAGGVGKSGRHGRTVRVEYLPERDDYWSVYEQADVLIMPRRYGGLSLPINEALSCGLPVITLDLPPYNAVLPPESLVPTSHWQAQHMKGGEFKVYDCDPRKLAQAMQTFAQAPELVSRLSKEADVLAASLDWSIWQAEWTRTLRG